MELKHCYMLSVGTFVLKMMPNPLHNYVTQHILW